jgi:hypothetical protein
MRFAISLVAILAVMASLPGDGDAASRRKQYKQTCGPTIGACIEAGGKRRRCTSRTLEQCRRKGVAVCRTTTTVTATTVTTTTIPTGPTGVPCESSGAPACEGQCGRRSDVCSNRGGTCACVSVRF